MVRLVSSLFEKNPVGDITTDATDGANPSDAATMISRNPSLRRKFPDFWGWSLVELAPTGTARRRLRPRTASRVHCVDPSFPPCYNA